MVFVVRSLQHILGSVGKYQSASKREIYVQEIKDAHIPEAVFELHLI